MRFLPSFRAVFVVAPFVVASSLAFLGPPPPAAPARLSSNLISLPLGVTDNKSRLSPITVFVCLPLGADILLPSVAKMTF